jgi:hypothetical protein
MQSFHDFFGKIQITTLNYEQILNNPLNYQSVYLTPLISKTSAQCTFDT